MGLESATFISELVATNPVGGTDPKSQGDDHLRMLKAVLQAQFPNLGAEAVTATAAQINNVIASGITGFANPSASIGLTANNGSGTTAMRANATPALSQAIAPIWTGVHTFAAASGIVAQNASGASYVWKQTGADTNEKNWDILASGGNLTLRAVNDAFNSAVVWGTVTRTGTTVDSIAFAATALTFNGSAVPTAASNVTWTGTHFFDGTIRADTVFIARAAQTGSAISAYVSFQDATNAEKGWVGFGAGTDDMAISNSTGGDISLAVTGAGIAAYGSLEIGYRLIPRVTSGLVHGKCFATAAGMTLNTSDMAEGRAFSIYNDSGSAITLTQGAGVTLRLGGTTTTGSRTIAARGLATIWCNSGTEAVVSGHVS